MGNLTVINSPNIFEIFVTIENELPNSSSGMSSMTISRLKSGVSSVTPGGRTGVARVTLSCMRWLSSPKSPFLKIKYQTLESHIRECKCNFQNFVYQTPISDRDKELGTMCR